jgi:hypothetical protein
MCGIGGNAGKCLSTIQSVLYYKFQAICLGKAKARAAEQVSRARKREEEKRRQQELQAGGGSEDSDGDDKSAMPEDDSVERSRNRLGDEVWRGTRGRLGGFTGMRLHRMWMMECVRENTRIMTRAHTHTHTHGRHGRERGVVLWQA